MSRGTPHISLRISPATLGGIDYAVELLRESKNDPNYNRTEFILHAIEEKLAKLERGRTSGRKRASRSIDGEGQAKPDPAAEALATSARS